MVAKRSSQQRAKQVYDALNKKLGSGLKDEPRTVLSQLMFNIIARNWTRVGSQKAFDELRRNFVDWNEVRISPVTEITGALETAGAPNAEKKAKNVKRILLDIYNNHHKITLDFLKDAKKEADARQMLEGLRGVSPNVVDGVLLFALDYAVVPLYSPIARVAKRTGIAEHSADGNELRKAITDSVPAKDLEKFCRLLIDHGERTCTLKSPNCKACMMRTFCPEPDRQKRLAEEMKVRAKNRAAEDKKRAAEEAKQAEIDRKAAEKKAKEEAAKAAAKKAKEKASKSKTKPKTSKSKTSKSKTVTKKKVTATKSSAKKKAAVTKKAAKKKVTVTKKKAAKKPAKPAPKTRQKPAARKATPKPKPTAKARAKTSKKARRR
ncbi:MAG: endonuclease III [Planctomycetota bacterium]